MRDLLVIKHIYVVINSYINTSDWAKKN